VGRILGLDVGKRRIGLAISTPEGSLAIPLRILERAGEESDLRIIASIAHEEQVEKFVVGYPRSLGGEVGPQAERVAAFARRLSQAIGLPHELWDERLSSVQAERSARAAGGPRRPSDDIAAAIILQAYLDRQRNA
jgi:putative holliday junction resolvase